MKFYTSVLPYRGRLLVRGVDKDGAQKKYRINYKPSLFIPTGKESKFKTLDGRNVAKIKFDSMPEATKWVNEYKNVTNFEYFGNTRHQYPFIAEEFKGKIDWDMNQIKLLSIDIECESENGFPSPEKADQPLICITVKDHTSKKLLFSVWATLSMTEKMFNTLTAQLKLILLKHLLSFGLNTIPTSSQVGM